MHRPGAELSVASGVGTATARAARRSSCAREGSRTSRTPEMGSAATAPCSTPSPRPHYQMSARNPRPTRLSAPVLTYSLPLMKRVVRGNRMLLRWLWGCRGELLGESLCLIEIGVHGEHAPANPYPVRLLRHSQRKNEGEHRRVRVHGSAHIGASLIDSSCVSATRCAHQHEHGPLIVCRCLAHNRYARQQKTASKGGMKCCEPSDSYSI